MYTFFEEHACDQQPPMAMLGILLGTHHRNPQHIDSMSKPLETSNESLGSRHRVVAHTTALIIEKLVVRPSAKLAPQEHIPHPGFS
jgi:hypothetical protein